jgi:alpha-tubulin suppressor-like RCC1 family protein
VTGPNGVGFLTGIIAIGTTGNHTLAVRSDGTVFAWGNNVYGQLGIGTTTPSVVPYPVAVSTISGLTNKPSVSTGWEHSLAADPTTGKAWGWGWDPYGQVGDGTLSQDVLTPSLVAAPVSFTEVGAGTWHSVGLGSDGSIWTWGYNFYGELGNGHSGLVYNNTPHAVSGVTAAQPQSC